MGNLFRQVPFLLCHYPSCEKSIDITTIVRFKLYPGGYLIITAIYSKKSNPIRKRNNGKKSHNRKYF